MMVNEKDLQEINKKLLEGYEIHIRKTSNGVRIAAEKTRVVVIKSPSVPQEQEK